VASDKRATQEPFKMISSYLQSRLAVRVACVIVAGVITFAADATNAQAPAAQKPATQDPKASPATETPNAPATLPSARSILDRHIAAIGGKDAVLSHSSTRATGTFSVASAGMNGSLEVIAAKPDKSMVKIAIPGVGEILEGYDGKSGWTLSPMTGPMLLDGKQLEEKRYDADFFSELHDDSRYASMITVEKSDFEGRPCYKVKLVRKNGGEDFEFYDVETGLKAGRIATRETPMGTITGTSVESDYKKFGNLLQPTTVKNTMMGMQQLITIASIEYDTVPPAAFEPPAEIKALIK
jgi:hypothetical protein